MISLSTCPDPSTSLSQVSAAVCILELYCMFLSTNMQVQWHKCIRSVLYILFLQFCLILALYTTKLSHFVETGLQKPKLEPQFQCRRHFIRQISVFQPCLNVLLLFQMTPKSKRKSIHSRMLRPVSRAFGRKLPPPALYSNSPTDKSQTERCACVTTRRDGV